MTGRARTIQPSAVLDVALWDAEQRTGLPLFRGFAGLWCHADREGRFEWKPRELKPLILPHWNGDYEDVLRALVADGFVVQYEVAGRQYGLVRNFKKHQHINTRETPSRLPPVPRGAKDPPVDHPSVTGANQEMTRISLFPELDQSSDPDLRFRISSGDSDPDLTGSAREDDEPETRVAAKSPFESAAEEEAFGYWELIVWRKVHATGSARATPKRLKPIRARLRDGATPDTIRRACEAVARSEFHLGKNESGTAYIEPGTLFRNAESLDKWLTAKPPTVKGVPGQTPADREMAERDAKLMDEIKSGVWGEGPRSIAAQRPIDMRKFRAAIDAGRVKRVTDPSVLALAAGIGRRL